MINVFDDETSRFPYIGSWYVFRTVVAQNVIAAMCLQNMPSILLSNVSFIARSPSPSLCGSNCVGHIVWVTMCGSHCVAHNVWVTMCGSQYVGHICGISVSFVTY